MIQFFADLARRAVGQLLLRASAAAAAAGERGRPLLEHLPLLEDQQDPQV